MTAFLTRPDLRLSLPVLGRGLLAFWFMLTSFGLSVFVPAAEHPNCPCGCQAEDSCQSSDAAASCCTVTRRPNQPKSCCATKSTKPSCCSQRTSSPSNHQRMPSWNVDCRCGDHSFHDIVLTEFLDIPPTQITIDFYNQDAKLPVLHFCYAAPSIGPLLPPPEFFLS